jgi:uncharacterized protein (TIGR03083 family)
MTNPVSDVSAEVALDHDEAMSLLAAELDRTIETLEALEDKDWGVQTDCPDWDVRQMYLHVLGACEAGASMRENMHQMRLGRKHRKANGGSLEAGLSNVQVREREELSAAQLLERMAEVAPTTVRKRSKTPKLMRRMKMKIDGPVFETWNLGYLIDTIYLRDMWMHRVDIAQATGRDMILTAEHDGRTISDVVAEWARRHGQPFTLILTGPAGGAYVSPGDGGEGESLEIDAVEFCRMLAGRAEATSLLTTIVPF